MKSRILNIIASPFFLAFILTVIIILFIPPVFPKYKAEVLSKNIHFPSANFVGCFDDLDNDGFSEYIYFKRNRLGNAAFTLSDYKLRIIRQWDFPGKYRFDRSSFYIISDYDNNGLKEIFIYFYRNDSLFLGYCEPMNPECKTVETIFVDKVPVVDGVPDFGCFFNAVHDFNKDGNKEIVFNIQARFGLQPRNVYMYDPVLRKIKKSPESYTLLSVHQIMDIDDDGEEELFTQTGSPGNVPQTAGYPYPDSSAWSMILEPDLSFKFRPMEFPGTQITVTNFGYRTDTTNYIVLFVKYLNKKYYKTPEVRIFDNRMNLLKILKLDAISQPNGLSVSWYYFNGKLCFYNRHTGKVIMLNPDLTLSEVTSKPIDFGFGNDFFDIDDDGLDEMISWNPDGVTIYRDKFKDPVTLKVPFDFDHFYKNVSRFLDGSGLHKAYLQHGRNNYLIRYEANPLYYFKYAIYAGIYLISLLFVFLIRWMQKYQLEQKQKIAGQITALQLRTIKSQFDPHFTFNVINSISYAVHKSDKEMADKYIAELSDFVRKIVTDSEKISRPLDEELTMVKHYLEIEKMRFRNGFDYRIKVDKKINTSVQLPKNMVLTFVENAVKHGIRPMKEHGLIRIDVSQSGENIQITVDDNGPGRHSGSGTQGTGKGFEIVKQILDLYHTLYKKKITYRIIDKEENGNPAGTRVVVTIPGNE